MVMVITAPALLLGFLTTALIANNIQFLLKLLLTPLSSCFNNNNHHHAMPLPKAASSSAIRIHSNQTSSIHNKKKRSSSSGGGTRLAFVVLLVLLSANFFALLLHVYYFLPEHDINIDLFHPGSIFATTSSLGTRTFKKRIRSPHVITGDDATASLKETLHNALSNNNDNNGATIRYDIVPTILEQTHGYYGVVHQLPSIPDRRRMIPTTGNSNGNGNFTTPSDAVNNLTYFLESRSRDDEEYRPLYLYNPMILPLDPNVLDPSIISNLSIEGVDISYVAVYRISNFGNCHGPGRGVPDTYHNYLGLALLDIDLNIVPHPTILGEYMDVVIDLNAHLQERRWTPTGRGRRKGKMKQYMQDCQLFVARPKSVDVANTMILLCNEYALPVRLEIVKGDNNNNGNNNDGNNNDGEFVEPFHFNNTYGSSLRLTAIHEPNMVVFAGKNMHYLPASGGIDGKHGPTFLEVWPGGPHEFTYVDFGSYPFVDRQAGEHPVIMNSSKVDPDPYFDNTPKGAVGGRNGGKNVGLLTDRDSGSACCVTVSWKDDDADENEQDRQLFLGISHRKTKRGLRHTGKYNYVSRIYVFETMPPFDVVARSGYFCLGFAPTNTTTTTTMMMMQGGDGDNDASSSLLEAMQSDNEQVWGATNEYKLQMEGVDFECPRIHFVTGIAEKVGDEDTVIISYGVNDCYPRMIEVSKKFLLGLLRP